MLKFELKSAYYPSSQSNLTNWEIVDFSSQDMTVNLTFSDSDKVSQYYFEGIIDQLRATFLDNEAFQSEDRKYRVGIGFTMEAQVPL
jgi:hypothetical protein